VIDEMLPCIAVASRPDGSKDFMVLWKRETKRHGDQVLILDPRSGRAWVDRAVLERSFFVHEQPVPFAAWYAWASSAEAQRGRERRAVALGLSSAEARSAVSKAAPDAATVKLRGAVVLQIQGRR
jgi:hypothetical protein